MKVISTFERFAANRSRVDLAGAIAAGVCAGTFTSMINKLNHELNLIAYARWILLAIAAYATVALLSERLCRDSLDGIIPVWVLTAFFGSMLFVAVNLIPSVVKGSYDPSRLEGSLTEYISTELDAARSVVIVQTLITLLVTATFHHTGHIMRALKAWHNGPKPPSISGRTTLKR